MTPLIRPPTVAAIAPTLAWRPSTAT